MRFLAVIMRGLAQFVFVSLLVLIVSPSGATGAEAAEFIEERGTRFATVWRIRGVVSSAARELSAERVLRAGDPVFVGEMLRADVAGEAVLRTEDAGILAVRPGATLVVDGFSAQGLATDHFSVRIVTGALRVITGWIGRTNRAEHRVVTATATIGIRGTDHEAYEMPAELARTLRQNAGTYDKVNRGGTTMEVNGNFLDIDPGRVGYARAAPALRFRGLLTLLLPVLLDTVPDFFVPGEFDAELDRLSPTIDEDAMKALEERRKSGSGALPVEPPARVPSASDSRTAPADARASSVSGTPMESQRAPTSLPAQGICDANAIARAWLATFDTAIAERNALTIVRLFAPESTLRASVRGASGAVSTIEMNRDEFAQSTVAALKNLTDFQHRRPSIEASIVSASAKECLRIGIRSVTIEQGRQGGLSYRFESLEEYVLEQRDGQWYAVSATTTQR